MLNEDCSLRFSWSAQERTAKATTNKPGFCHEKGYMMDTAQQIVTQLAQGDFAAVEQRLADLIKPLLPVEALRASWQGIEQQVGAFQELGKTSAVQTPQGLVQVVTCVFERASLDVNITLNDAGEIVALTITPVGTVEQQANATYEPPSYAQLDRFHEQEVQIGHGKWVLPGTVSLPQATGRLRRCFWCMDRDHRTATRRSRPTSRSAIWPGDWPRRASPCCATRNARKSMPPA